MGAGLLKSTKVYELRIWPYIFDHVYKAAIRA